MIIKNLDQLIEIVKKNNTPKKVAVIVANDALLLEAVFRAKDNNIIKPFLIGNIKKIRHMLKVMNFDADEGSLIEADNDIDSANKGVELANNGTVDFLMKGKLQTADLLRAVVDKNKGLRTDNIMSHISIVELPNYHKILIITDVGMVMYPNLDQKKQILKNALKVLSELGYKEPKVALLAAVETVNEKMPETIDAIALKQMNIDGKIKNCYIEGPISYDLAISKKSAILKGYKSPVSGDADILLVPNITVGNVLIKSLLVSGCAKMVGFIFGSKVPIALNTRSATSEEKYLSLVMSAAASAN